MIMRMAQDVTRPKVSKPPPEHQAPAAAIGKARGASEAPTEYSPAVLNDPYGEHAGAPLKHSIEVIEQALHTVAFNGGNVARSCRSLAAIGIELDPQTVRRWIRGRFRNRYHEIQSKTARDLEEQIARDATDLALQQAHAERQAMERTLAGLSDANGVEASQILRNLSQSKAIQVDKAGQLRGRASVTVDVRGFEEIARSLERLGIATVRDTGYDADIPDADVEES